MIYLFRETKLAYLISSFAGAIWLIIALPPYPLANLPRFATFFALWLFLNVNVFTWIARRKAMKVDQLHNDCDLESYTDAYEAFSRKCKSKIFSVSKTVKTYVALNLSTAYINAGNYQAAGEVLAGVRYFSKNRTGVMYQFFYHNNYFVYYIRTNHIHAAEETLGRMKLLMQSKKLRKKEKETFSAIYAEKKRLLQMEKGDYSDCQQVFEKAYKEADRTIGKVSYQYTLGKIYLHDGKIAEAEAAFTYAAENGGTSVYKKQALEQLEALGKPLFVPEEPNHG